MVNRLQDKVVVITGATSGIGLEIARLSVSEGANVVISGRRENEGKKIALFGAGLYNAVLINILKEPKFDFVIDEVRAGRFFEGIEIISLDDAVRSEEAMVVFLCSRPSNLDYINEKLENKGFQVETLL